jgi:predicted acylesterase/phospholipase RssA
LIDLNDPATYPLAAELTTDAEKCDLVMKGGITSGVIYPHAICQLAATRRLCNVGGTSAGAIGAAGAAAAEYGRDAGAGANGRTDVGYPRLASLPHTLAETVGRHTRLFHLFQPQAGTQALYRLLAVWISGGSTGVRAWRSVIPALGCLLRKPTLWCVGIFLVIGVPAIYLICETNGSVHWATVVAKVLLILGLLLALLVALLAAVAWSLVRRTFHDLKANNFGLCSGMEGPNSSAPALTPWLADEFDAMAGLGPDQGPLTFGLLHENYIELAMLTTDLSAGTQNELPFKSRIWAFRPHEFEKLFPKRIVDHLIAHAPNDPEDKVLQRFWDEGYCPLPDSGDIPVIVAVRMSLSFPVLLSAVPLYAVDYTVSSNDIVPHWFSDGGITSNFPIHFFDAAVPSWPTFGINLVKVQKVYPDQERNVLLPPDNGDGLQAPTVKIDTMPELVGAIRNTLQNWADSMQCRVPGYRGRIVAVNHTKEEGGMNLDMGREVVSELAERGQYAGKTTDDFNFNNHRWVRFRSFLQTLDDSVKPAGPTLSGKSVDGIASYDDLIANPPSYRSQWSHELQQDFLSAKSAMVSMSEAFTKVCGDVDHDDNPITNGAPNPQPRLQVRPRPIS